MSAALRSLVERLRERDSGPDRVGLFVDGPNVLRDEFDVDLDDVREEGRSIGDLALTRLYVDEHATPGLIQAAEARGFEVVVTSGDVDVKLAVDAVERACSGTFDALVVVSRDTDFKPVVETAARYGLETIALAPGELGRSDALANAVTEARVLDD
ncbi:NYN domain-containing protein [Halobacteriales archaeon SW_7_68_16]|nr:MAG: NYN domain-containing protein [Halobacteriales archaeon SW_7_68_16]